MVGGRGCIEKVGANYMVTVAWQGLTPLNSPGTAVACGKDLYDKVDTPCVNDRCRRTVTTLVGIAKL
jgi:type IV pilus assembly protein PilV